MRTMMFPPPSLLRHLPSFRPTPLALGPFLVHQLLKKS